MTVPVGFSQVTFLWDGPNLPNGAATVFGIENINNDTPAQIGAGLDGMSTLQTLVALGSSNVNLRTIRVKNGPDATGPFAETAANILGSDADPGLPPQVALLVRKNTLLGGRRGRGRMYWPGQLENEVEGSGNYLSGDVATYQTAFDNWLTALNLLGYPMVLLHEPGISGEPAPTDVTSLSVQVRCGTQRRRNRP